MKKLLLIPIVAISCYAFGLSEKVEIKGSYYHQSHSITGTPVNYDKPKENGYSIAIANYFKTESSYKPFVEIEKVELKKRDLTNLLIGIEKNVYKDISVAGGIGYSKLKWGYEPIASSTKNDYTSNKPVAFLQTKYTKEIDKTKDISIGVREYMFGHKTDMTRTTNTMIYKDKFATSIFLSFGVKF